MAVRGPAFKSSPTNPSLGEIQSGPERVNEMPDARALRVEAVGDAVGIVVTAEGAAGVGEIGQAIRVVVLAVQAVVEAEETVRVGIRPDHHRHHGHHQTALLAAHRREHALDETDATVPAADGCHPREIQG